MQASRNHSMWIRPVAMAGALAALVLLVGCAEEPAAIRLEAGLARLREGDYAGAIRHLEKARRAMPANITARVNLGLAFWKAGDTRRAIEEFSAAAAMEPTDLRPLELLGLVHLQSGDLVLAGRAFEEALQRNPYAVRSLTGSAVVEMRAGHWERAQHLLKQAVETDPAYGPALFNLAVVYRDGLSQAKQAGEYFRRYLKVGKDPARIEKARAFVGGAPAEVAGGTPPRESGRRKEEPRVRSPQADPERESRGPDPLVQAALKAVEKQAYDEAVVLLNQALNKQPRNAEALWALADLYDRHLGRPERAEQTRARLKEFFPDDPRVRDQRPGMAEEDAGTARAEPPREPTLSDREAAREAFTEGLRYHKARQWGPAIDAYRKALERDRKFAYAAYNLGLVYKDTGQLEIARDAFTYALLIEPTMLKASYMLAIVHMELKDNPRAIEQLNRVLKLDPGYARAYYLLGLVCRAEMRMDEARKAFQRYVELAPKDPAAREARDWLDSVDRQRKRETRR